MPDPHADTRLNRAAFLAGAGWADAAVQPLAGDASRRRYARLSRPGGETAILMDADPATCGSQQAFVTIAAHLHRLSLSAPDVLTADLANGYLLLQDFGDRLFAREAERSPSAERQVYTLACDVLVRLAECAPLDGLTRASPEHLTDLAALAFEHYAPIPEADAALEALHQALQSALTGPDVLIMRDYHAENLVFRPSEAGLAQAGLLDFQDALAGHPAYDLVSLLQDARRDLAPGLEADLLTHYLTHTGQNTEAFMLAYHSIAVQRHLRILGIFARLCREGKPHYLAYVPRTWAHLQAALDAPGLDALAAALRGLPAPTPDHLQTLRAS